MSAPASTSALTPNTLITDPHGRVGVVLSIDGHLATIRWHLGCDEVYDLRVGWIIEIATGAPPFQ